MRTVSTLVIAGGFVLAACAASTTPGSSDSPPAVVSASPPATPVATAAVASATATPFLPTPVASGIPADATTEEAQLLGGARLDVQGRCTTLRTGLVDGAVAAIDCAPASDVVDHATLYLFDTRQAMLGAYTALVEAHDIPPYSNGGRCEPGRPSEGGYVPGDGHGIVVVERGACYLDGSGLAHYIATMPPFVVVEVEGKVADVAEVERWAWLGNQDQPGGPTIWSSSGPKSPEK